VEQPATAVAAAAAIAHLVEIRILGPRCLSAEADEQNSSGRVNAPVNGKLLLTRDSSPDGRYDFGRSLLPGIHDGRCGSFATRSTSL
jgi:hypothetical protein